MLEFRILGPLEVWDGSSALRLGGHKQRALLAMLLLDAGRVVSVDRLIDGLWGDHPPRTAPTSLQNFVSGLRKTVGDGLLLHREPGYVLRVEPQGLDLERFRRRVDEARRLPPADRATALREALDLWRGPPLADFAFDAFAQTEISRLEELRLTALEARFDAELEAGHDGDLVAELESLVRNEPHRERLRAQLMLALYRTGRQAEALEVYLDARRTLVEELGIDPGPELQRLYSSILRQEPSLRPSATTPRVDDQVAEVARAIAAGRLVPILGSDVTALTASLAERFALEPGSKLPQLAQEIAVMQGSGPLYDELHALLAEGAVPAAVHRFLATLPPLLRKRGVPHQLLVTTALDLSLERAFVEAGEEFDLVSYVASGPARGRFCHIPPDGHGRVIELPNTYVDELSLERRTVSVKLHGRVDPTKERRWESFVVTEDDHIDYLAQTGVGDVLPVSLAATLQRSHLLFLGYTMSDWNLRVVLHRLWGSRALSYRSWAVQPEPRPLEREFWRRRDVDVLEFPLADYVAALARHSALEAER
jgi:DNA-binding SARP family transcriptional activator